MGLFVLFLILIGLLGGGVAYIVWIIHSIMWKRFRLLALLLLVPVVMLSCLLIGMQLYSKHQYEQYLASLFSVPASLGVPLFEYNSPRSLNGDGYSFSVYALPLSIEKRFSEVDRTLCESFPVRPKYRSRWKTVTWQSTPFASDYEMYLKFCLPSYDKGKRPELQKHFDDIRASLSATGNYYAFFHYNHGNHPSNIDFFLIDLINKKVYMINHNI